MRSIYNENAECPKCGCKSITTLHSTVFGHELITRGCVRCEYAWSEAPLDTPPEAEG